MYTIEYYKTKREKPEIKEPEKNNYMVIRRYLHQRDLIEKCWNIKSLTIDVEDIYHVVQDKNLKHLFSLYARINRLNLDNNMTTITILNNNSINLSYIYEIINCKWMVNASEELNDLVILKIAAKRLIALIDEYNKASDQKIRRIIKNEIELIKYYIDTIIRKSNKQVNDIKSLKLGKHFIR